MPREDHETLDALQEKYLQLRAELAASTWYRERLADKVRSWSRAAAALSGDVTHLSEEREQAIDALRQIRATPVADAPGMKMWDIADQALAKLGENP